MKAPTCLGTILFVDDDPDHLKIYGWILEKAGFSSVPCLASRSGIDSPRNLRFDLIVLDYNLNCLASTAEIARTLLDTYPAVPIVLLSQIDGLPFEMESLVTAFVRKGDPRKLTDTIRKLLPSQDEAELPK